MIVGFLSSGIESENIWVGGSSEPDIFQPNTIQSYQLIETQQYMCHVEVKGQRINSPALQYNSIVIWDGDCWTVATPF